METFLDLLSIVGILLLMLSILVVPVAFGALILYYSPTAARYLRHMCELAMAILAFSLFYGALINNYTYLFDPFWTFFAIFSICEFKYGLKNN